MESFVIYGIVAIIVVVSIVRNYLKEDQKNKERARTQPRPRLVPSQNQENSQSGSSPAPFSRPRRLVSEQSDNSTSTASYPTVAETVYAASQRTSIMDYDYTQEGVSAVSPMVVDDRDEQEAFSQNSNVYSSSSDLQLETKEDLRRAFIHTIVLERKY